MGHWVPVTFLMVLPLTQAIVDTATFDCVSLARTIGEENSKLLADNESHPSFSPTTTVAICGVPSALVTETVALIGAFEK